MTIGILLVDDQSVVRKGRRTFLKYDSELEVIGEAADGAEVLSLARELTPDVVLMDLVMPVMDGIAATAGVSQKNRPNSSEVHSSAKTLKRRVARRSSDMALPLSTCPVKETVHLHRFLLLYICRSM